MKFLVLALCVCAASAASYGSFGNYRQTPNKYNPVFGAQASAQVYPQAPKTVPVVVKAVPVATVAPVAPVVVVEPVVPVKPAPYVPAPVVKTATKNYKDETVAQVVSSVNEVSADGYRFAFETENGISAQSTGSLKNVDNTPTLVAEGKYSYYAPDGTPVEVRYISDEFGFRAEGNVLPVGPEIPEAIARSLAYIAAHPQPVDAVKKF